MFVLDRVDVFWIVAVVSFKLEKLKEERSFLQEHLT